MRTINDIFVLTYIIYNDKYFSGELALKAEHFTHFPVMQSSSLNFELSSNLTCSKQFSDTFYWVTICSGLFFVNSCLSRTFNKKRSPTILRRLNIFYLSTCTGKKVQKCKNLQICAFCVKYQAEGNNLVTMGKLCKGV